MKLDDIISQFTPESWGRGENWDEHATRLWQEESKYMTLLRRTMMAEGKWIEGPITVNDNVVQDGHHRIVIAFGLEWDKKNPIEIPVEFV